MKKLLAWAQTVARNTETFPLDEDEVVSATLYGVTKYIRDFLAGKFMGVHKPLLAKYIRTEILNTRQCLLTAGRNWFNTVDMYGDNDIILVPDTHTTDPYYSLLRKEVARAVLTSNKLTPKHKALFILLNVGWSWRDSCELCKIFKVNSQGLSQLWRELQSYVKEDLLLLGSNRYYERRLRRQILVRSKSKLQQLRKMLLDTYEKLQTTNEKSRLRKRLKAIYREIAYVLETISYKYEEFRDHYNAFISILSGNDYIHTSILLKIDEVVELIDQTIEDDYVKSQLRMGAECK